MDGFPESALGLGLGAGSHETPMWHGGPRVGGNPTCEFGDYGGVQGGREHHIWGVPSTPPHTLRLVAVNGAKHCSPPSKA